MIPGGVVLALSSPFEAFSTAFLLGTGTAFVLAGLFVLAVGQLRAAVGMPARASLVLAAAAGAMTWYYFLEHPAMLETLRAIVAVTAVLVPAAATVIAIRGLLGVA